MRIALMAIVAGAFLAGCASVSDAQTAAPAPPPCSAPEFSQLDFWLGDWDATWEGGQGVNHITKVLDGCVIQEEFDGGASTNNLHGHSVSTYHAGISQWRQTWVDNQGGYFALTGGPVDGRFILTNTRVRDNAPYLRMVFEDIEQNSFTWRWQRSTDAGATWTDAWLIHYTRRQHAQ